VTLSFAVSLRCQECGKEYPFESGLYACPECGGKLEVVYDYEAIKESFSLEKLKSRPWDHWRYIEFLPLDSVHVTLHEGGTWLIRSRRLAEELGLKNLYIKNETTNPTASFKDRPISVGVNRAIELGARVVVTASSGNAAAALTALGARAGLRVVTFVPHDAPAAKLAQLRMLGATVIPVEPVEGELGDPTVKLMRLSWKKYGWHPVPSFGPFNPYQIEGAKTLLMEVMEELGFSVPDQVYVPVGGAGLLSGHIRALDDFRAVGLIDALPRIIAVQPEGNRPFVEAFRRGSEPETWPNPRSIAGGLLDPYTWDWRDGFRALRETGGTAVAVPDDLIWEAQKMLARYEGIFVEPSGAASLAGLMLELREGDVDRSDLIVVEATGSGFKDLDIVVQRTGLPEPIPGTEEALEERLKSEGIL